MGDVVVGPRVSGSTRSQVMAPGSPAAVDRHQSDSRRAQHTASSSREINAAARPFQMRLCSGSWACCGRGMCSLSDFRELAVKSVREPDAGNPQVGSMSEEGKLPTASRSRFQRPSSILQNLRRVRLEFCFGSAHGRMAL
jgi:hypothetical protein